jgi:hypothetical protein
VTPRVTLVSLRQGLHWWPQPVGCIQDAFFALLESWLRARRMLPRFWNVSWSADKPVRDDAALAEADWLFVFSSNEFTYHASGVVNPLAVTSSNLRLARIARHFAGKPVVLFTMDAHDTAALLQSATPLRAVALGPWAVIDEADFPLTVQSVRYEQLRALAGDVSAPETRRLDFAYWGTTKRQLPGGTRSFDARQAIVREVLGDGLLRTGLIGNHFGARAKATHPFHTRLGDLVPLLAEARATCCFQWPGQGHRLTARYHEAMALGLLPFVHEGYDTEKQVASAPWQRIRTSAELRQRLLEVRDGACWWERWEEARERYDAARPSDAAQLAQLTARLDGRMAAA